ncbi:MAG TPA: Gfo/Idh/MocA family oxidoreductase, partial [Chloroflexi bacterium]|nr:Gfo/Idh/MocA family oxidoreductase [Chloroflexota bacterium]
MAKHENVDVVDVCTPTFLHKSHVMEGLENGLHAITEKPIALHKKDAEEMYALADAKGKLLFVGQVLQFTKEVELLRDLVRNQKYGKVLDAYFVRLSACPRWVKNGWLFDKERSGLLPFDLHIHDLDVIISLFGKPESFSFTSCGNEDKNYKEHYRFSYQYNDFNIAAEAAWFNADFPFTANWRVYFEKAVVVNDGNQVIAYQFDHEPHIFDTEETIKIPTGINLPPTGMFYAELSHFMNCIREGKPSELVSRDQVLTVVELLEEISQKDG